MKPDLLAFSNVTAQTTAESKLALLSAASLAREQNKNRILFMLKAESLPAYPSFVTSFTALALACGADISIQSADPEGRAVKHADWVRVLDSASLMSEAVACIKSTFEQLPDGIICFDTDAGQVSIESSGGCIDVRAGVKSKIPTVKWPANALAQLVSGHLPIETLCAIHNTQLPIREIALLQSTFPQKWKLSMDESWVFEN